MRIVSKIERKQPGVNPPVMVKSFVVEFGENRERKYEFVLDEKTGKHHCDVKHKEDALALVAISDGYEIHPDDLDALDKAGGAEGAKAKAAAEAKAKAEAYAMAKAAAAIEAIDDLDHDELVEAVTKETGKAPAKGHDTGAEMRKTLKALVPAVPK